MLNMIFAYSRISDDFETHAVNSWLSIFVCLYATEIILYVFSVSNQHFWSLIKVSINAKRSIRLDNFENPLKFSCIREAIVET